MDIQEFLSEFFLSFIKEDGSVFIGYLLLYYLNRILFLEKHTPKQEKKIKKMYLAYGLYELVHLLFLFIISLLMSYVLVNLDNPEFLQQAWVLLFSRFYRAAFFIISNEFLFGTHIIGFAILTYVTVTGRKKHKWLGIFTVIVLQGYRGMLDAVIEIPVFFIYRHSGFWSGIYQIIVSVLILVVFYRLFSEKHKPAFLRRMDEEAQSRSLSFREETGLWLMGGWLLVYRYLVPGPDPDPDSILYLFIEAQKSPFLELPDFVRIYLSISNSVLCFVITAMIIGGSYRRLYYEKNMKLQKSLISTMANLVESRDDNTGGHIHRTAKYVEIIAEKLRKDGKFADVLTDKYVKEMVIAAPLHDVGKIHISDAILNKPGRLEENEFAIMKTHSAAGGEIIHQVEEDVGEDISYLSIAKDMAEYHHERMDGTGYPYGLSGNDIPVCARILAVADVFDALISKRCYKDAMPLDQAFAIIREEAGDHFDTDIAKAFLDSREEVERFLKELDGQEGA